MSKLFVKGIKSLVVYFFGLLCIIASATTTPEMKITSMQTTIMIPSLTAVENYPQAIEKAGVIISVEPFEFKHVKKIREECQEEEKGISIGNLVLNLNSPDPNSKHIYHVKRIPVYLIDPSHIKFKIRITNKLNHVLRLAGSVIAFQVNSKSIAIDKSGYQDLLDGIILPRQETEFTIVGPNIDTIEDNSAITFLLYDVVTKTDAAGNATERTNFEWYYKFNKTTSEVMTDSAQETTEYMTVVEANEKCGKIFDQ